MYHFLRKGVYHLGQCRLISKTITATSGQDDDVDNIVVCDVSDAATCDNYVENFYDRRSPHRSWTGEVLEYDVAV